MTPNALNDKILAQLDKVYEVIDRTLEESIARLGEACLIPSVSAVPEARPEVLRMAEWVKHQIAQDWPEAKIETHTIEPQVIDGVEYPYPPLVCAKLQAEDRNKKTLLVYAHYDVQPAIEADGWSSNPWVMTRTKIDGDELLGARGVSDDKSQAVGWLCALRAHKLAGVELPVNVRILYEGMEETGCWMTDKALAVAKKNSDILDNIDYLAVSDGGWNTPTRSSIIYGLKGYTLADIEVSGPKIDLHSGGYGGVAYHPLDDLVYLLNNLKDENDTILIPGIQEQIAPMTDVELRLLNEHEEDLDAIRERIGAPELRHKETLDMLVANWREPALTIHGIEGAHHEPGVKTVIPCKVIGKMSIRSVPNMDGPTTEKCIVDYLEGLMAKRKTANKLKVSCRSGPWWYSNPEGDHVRALISSLEAVHGHTPDKIRCGGSIPCTPPMQEATGASTIIMVMGRSDDGAHSQNEKLNVSNYRSGMKLYARYMQELAQLA